MYVPLIAIYFGFFVPFIILIIVGLFVFRLRKQSQQEYVNQIESLENTIWKQKEKFTELSDKYNKTQSEGADNRELLLSLSEQMSAAVSGIMGLSELILDAQPNEKIQSYARTIMGASEGLTHVANDIQKFSLNQSDDQGDLNIAIDIQELVNEICQLYAFKAQENEIELAVRFALDTEKFVITDPTPIRQVLSILLMNSLKYTSDGFISITVEDVKKNATLNDNVTLRFTVEDTGKGIPDTEKEEILKDFVKEGHSRSLFFCKSMVERMGGQIDFFSEENKGTKFFFTVPVKRNAREVMLKARPESLRNLKVLVVDDLILFRELMREKLEDAGMVCSAAESGKEALNILKQAAEDKSPFDIVIIDYVMPGMKGDELAKAICEHDDLAACCLILMSAIDDSALNTVYTDYGFSDFLPKPINTEKLIDDVEKIWRSFCADVTSPKNSSSISKNKEETIDLSFANILIVEDNLVNQFFIQELVEQAGATYDIASDGLQALNAVQKNTQYDLIIMDCMMPELDGYEASKQIKRLKPYQNIPILALTANSGEGDREKCLAAGMDDYLPKPIEKDIFLNKVEALLHLKGSQKDAG